MNEILEALSGPERAMFADLVSMRDQCGIKSTRCRGFAIGDGNYSGCAYGDGAANGSLGEDVCPACNNTGEETR